MEPRVLVGLGNPGTRYEGSRHNLGFAMIDKLWCGSWNAPKFDCLTAQGRLFERSLWYIKPLTFMNLSGEPLRQFADFHRIALSEILVIYDEIDLPLGSARLKVGGGDGGHRGVRSIMEIFGSGDFVRLRLGVGRPSHPGWDISDWVLGKFSVEERVAVDGMLVRAEKALSTMFARGFAEAQNQLHAENVAQ